MSRCSASELAEDSAPLPEQFGGNLAPADLMALPKYTAYVRLLIDGMPSRPFSMETLQPQWDADEKRLETIRRTSRHRYARPASQVQHEIEDAFVAV